MWVIVNRAAGLDEPSQSRTWQKGRIMTGKQLKEWAAKVNDEAQIIVLTKYDYKGEPDFKLRATLTVDWPEEQAEAQA